MLACAALLAFVSGCARYFNKGAAAVAQMAEPVRVSTETGDAAEPVVAAARDGTAYVAWVEHRAHKESDVFVAQLDREGRALHEPVRVNAKAGEATAWRGDPPTIAVGADGTIYIGWTARAGAEGHATDLYLSTSRDGGRSFAPAVKVNDDPVPGVHGMHSLAVASDGRVYLAWLDERNLAPAVTEQNAAGQKKMEHMERNREVFTSFSTDGGRSFSANRRVASEACPCCKTSLAVGTNSRVYVGWRQVLPGEYRHIAVASSADGGQTYSRPVIVSDDRWVIPGCPVSGPALAVALDGALRVMWFTAGERGTTGLYWAESRDAGQTFSERKLFAGGQAFGTPLLLASVNDKPFVVWGDNNGGTPRVLASPLVTGGKEGSAPVAMSAELPSAAMTGDQLFIGYIVNANDRRSIWVVRAKPVV
jgi:BNR repeat-like domain